MTTAYFVLCLTSLLFTVNVFLPVFRQPTVALFSFAAGWLTSELTLHFLTLQVLGTWLFVRAGAVTGPLGSAGLLLSLLSWGGMAFMILDSLRTRDRIEATLQQALGSDYAAPIASTGLAQPEGKLRIGRLLRPFHMRLPGVRRVKDLVYGNEGGIELKLDVYHAEPKPANAPVLLQIHGGGWTENLGDKNYQALPLMNELAASGWVCVSVDYRLSPTARWPAHIIDCKLCLKWIREHVVEYGGDPDFVVATGGSAGGHLCSLLALTAGDPEFQPGFESADASVQACVPFYGIYDLTDAGGKHHHGSLVDYVEKTVFDRSLDEERELFEKASPLHRVHEHAPPFFVIHGENDSLASIHEADVFVQRLRSVSRAPVAYQRLPHTQHAFDVFRSPRSEYVLFAVVRYVNAVYGRYLESRSGAT